MTGLGRPVVPDECIIPTGSSGLCRNRASSLSVAEAGLGISSMVLIHCNASLSRSGPIRSNRSWSVYRPTAPVRSHNATALSRGDFQLMSTAMAPSAAMAE
jgi:hypothetical protein